jgi:hypothetical protein
MRVHESEEARSFGLVVGSEEAEGAQARKNRSRMRPEGRLEARRRGRGVEEKHEVKVDVCGLRA